MRQIASFQSLRPFLCALRTGSWLTRERLRAYPAMLGGLLVLAIVGLVATGHNGKDHWNRPLGVDFSGIWVAGQEVRAGHPAQPYDNVAHAAAQAAAFGPSDSFLPWPYPPFALAVAALLATVPYLAALALWQGATLLLYVVAVVRAAHGSALALRDVLLAALAFPAVAVNVFHGQNGFLSAGLIALGGFCLPRRPLLAGLLLGLLAYKPQFAIAVPLALIAGGYWRAGAAGAATVLAMTLATGLAFGAAPWQGFASSLSFVRHVILEGGGLESYKLQSTFAAVRLLGGSVAFAYAAQGAVTLVVLATLGWLWHGAADLRLKVAGLILASLLATPYAVDYDMAMLGPALAALVAFGLERGFSPYGKSLLAVSWAMPLAARGVAMTLGVPIGVIVMAVLYVAIVRRARAACGSGVDAPVLAPR